MLSRRDFLKLLGLGTGVVLAAPALLVPPPLVVPEPRVFQLDRTMLNRPLADVVRRQVIVGADNVGTIYINDRPIATMRSWSTHQHVEPGFSGYNRLHECRIVDVKARVDIDAPALEAATLRGDLVSMELRAPNGATYWVPGAHIDQLEYSSVGDATINLRAYQYGRVPHGN